MTEAPLFDVPGHREPVCGLASEAVGSTDEGGEHRVDRVISSGLWSHQLPCFQVHHRMGKESSSPCQDSLNWLNFVEQQHNISVFLLARADKVFVFPL